MIIKIVLILCVPASFWWTYHIGYKAGVVVGDRQGYSRAADWFAAHPTIIMGEGSTVNNNVSTKRSFEACIWPLRFGW
jgi:hypothetical protein